VAEDDLVRDELLQRFRAYLALFARSRLGPRLQAKVDASDLVQQTMLKAHEKKDQFRGRTAAELLAWLRQILANEVAGVVRKYQAEARDLHRELSVQTDLDASSARLEALLALDQTSPSQCASREEEHCRLAEALGRLPTDQRDCIELHHLQGLKLAEVAELLGRSEEAVVGLLYRGLKKLRQLLGAAQPG
jgi:RNA polymerase sigma-70 factor (ECF subfamily)